MTKRSKEYLKPLYKNGSCPDEHAFWDWLDSYWHKDEKLTLEDVTGLTELLNQFFNSTLDEVNKVVKQAVKGFQIFESTIDSITNQAEALCDNIDVSDKTKLINIYDTLQDNAIVLKKVLNDALADGILTQQELKSIQDKYDLFNESVDDFYIEYQLLQNALFASKQNNLVAGNLVTLTDNATNKTTKVDVQSDPAKQNNLKAGTLVELVNNTDKTTTVNVLHDDAKQNKLVAGTLVELKNNANNTTTISVKSDATKQNKLIALNDTVVLEEKADGTTGIKAVFTDIVQDDTISGTKILEVIDKIVTVTSTAQTNYIGFKSDLNTFKLVNLSDLQVYISLDNPQASTNKIIKDAVISQYILPKYSTIEFLKTPDGWLVIDLYGVTYFRDLADESRIYDYNVITNSDGTPKIEEIREIQEIDESATSLTANQLNERYPNAVGGFTVVCNRVMYIKSSHSEGKWQSSTLNTVN